MDAVLHALAEPHRRQILGLVRDGELSAGGIAERFRLTRPAISQHLAVLREAGLLSERREGTRRWYRARPDALAGVRIFVDELWNERLALLKRAAEAIDRAGPECRVERVSVEREVIIDANREVVWSLLVDPKAATRWMGVRASFDLHVGGQYRVEVLPGHVTAGAFLEIEPSRRLVHTWGWAGDEDGAVPPGSTIVVYELFDYDGQTRLRLCHSGLPSIDTAGSHSRGWAHYLPRLVTAASGRSPGRDPWVADPARMQRELKPASSGSRRLQRKKGRHP